jgi:hypothetical protein
MCPNKKQDRKGQKTPDPVPSPTFSEEVYVSLTGVGDLIDVRFKIDEKMRRPGPLYVQDEASGKMCRVASAPKIGLLMSGRKKIIGTHAYGIFINTDDTVKSGSLITFAYGEFRREHIRVS